MERDDGVVVQGIFAKCFCPSTRSASEYLIIKASHGVQLQIAEAFRQYAVLIVTVTAWSVGLAFDLRKGQYIFPFSRTVHTGPGVHRASY